MLLKIIVAGVVISSTVHLAHWLLLKIRNRLDFKKSGVGFVRIGGRPWKVISLSLDRMDLLNGLLASSVDPTGPYSVERTQRAMVEVIRLAVPMVPWRVLRRADGRELETVFHQVLDLYKLGGVK